MNLAFYSHYFTPEIGAPSARIYDMAQQWLKLKQTVHVITCFPNHPNGRLYPGYTTQAYKHQLLDDIHVHRNWTYITPNEGFIKKTLGHISLLPSSILFSNRHIPNVDVAIGTSPTFFAAMAAAYLAKRRRIPFVVEVRGLWPAIFVELGVLRNATLIKLLERWELALYRQATRIVTVTESFRRNLIERGVPAEKVHTITNGADVEFWQPIDQPFEIRKQLGLDGKFVVLYMGAHGISHALVRILESARQLKEQPNIQFLFVGEGAEKAKLITQAQQIGLNNVHFLDAVNQKAAVKRYYALSDVCLVPLRDVPLFETFIPSKMFEIMAMSRPMIGSVKGEAADILNRSRGALVVPPEASQEITTAIMHLYHHPEQRTLMGKQGRQFVEQEYSRQALASRYLNVLNEAVSVKKSERIR